MTNPIRRKTQTKLSGMGTGLTMKSRSTSHPYSTAPKVNRKIQKLQKQDVYNTPNSFEYKGTQNSRVVLLKVMIKSINYSAFESRPIALSCES